MSTLQVLIESDFSALDGLQKDWDEVTASHGGSVYLSFDWARTWWAHYGKGKKLRLFLFRRDDQLVGVVPMYIDQIWPSPVGLRVARLVGANIPPKAFSIGVDSTVAEEVFATVVERLVEDDRCDLVSFGPISDLSPATKALEQWSAENPALAGRYEVDSGIHSSFSVPATMDEFYANLSKNERKNRRKYELRLLRKEFEDARVDVLSDSEAVEAELERFAEQHTRQWHAARRPGGFGAWPKGLDFNRALVRVQGRLGRVRFIRILAGEEVVSNQYAFAFGDTYYWELPSREMDPRWSRFSLGPTGLVVMLEAALEEGMERLEGGLAHYDYKVRLGALEHSVKRIRIVGPTRVAKLRVGFFNMLRKWVRLAYHKVWYRRIAPRLSKPFWGPQWSFWLRLDF